ncbi:MAG: hypothetical protein P4M13_11020 [Alphaproteobacteria bacterium]|nr:hypothetical protein [Alphaproteobacteria bacterium]
MSEKTETPRKSSRDRAALKWEISGVLLFKISMILLASLTVFGAAHRIQVDPRLMSERILSRN